LEQNSTEDWQDRYRELEWPGEDEQLARQEGEQQLPSRGWTHLTPSTHLPGNPDINGLGVGLNNNSFPGPRLWSDRTVPAWAVPGAWVQSLKAVPGFISKFPFWEHLAMGLST
jgi:hypothetical protein